VQEKYAIYRNAGALVLLSSRMTEQEKQDVQHSLLFAQLVATNMFPLDSEQDNWYATWQQVLKDNWLEKSWKSFELTPPRKSSDTAMTRLVDYMEGGLESADKGTLVPVLKDIVGRSAADPLIESLHERVQQSIEHDPADEPGFGRFRFLLIVAQPGPRINATYMTLKSSVVGAINPYSQIFTAANVSGLVEQYFLQLDLAPPLFDPIREILAGHVLPYMDLIEMVTDGQVDEKLLARAG
jgi:hypothetical protein